VPALRQNGSDLSRAIYAYNHAQWYVDRSWRSPSGYAQSAGLQGGAPVGSVVDAALQFAYTKLAGLTAGAAPAKAASTRARG
jgi:hypothetical protein